MAWVRIPLNAFFDIVRDKTAFLAYGTYNIMASGCMICKYPNAQFTSTGNGIPISSNGTHFQYCPFTDPTSGNFPFGTVPKLAICHYWYCAILVCTISITGRPISGTGLCHFRHGHSLGPVPELDSMRVVPFPVPGSASSGMVIFRVPY